MVPNEGVVPPSEGLSQSSILSAPACAAAIAEEMLKQAISNKGGRLINYILIHLFQQDA
jgi:hypothetical protein